MDKNKWRLAEIPLDMFEKNILAPYKGEPGYMVFDAKKGKDGVVQPAEGGILSYYLGQKYPYKGLMIAEPLKRINILKRIVREAMTLMLMPPFRYLLPLLMLFPD